MEDTCQLPKVKKYNLANNGQFYNAIFPKTHAELTYYIANRLAQISCNHVQLEHDSIVYTHVQGGGEGEMEICNLYFPFVSVITINNQIHIAGKLYTYILNSNFIICHHCNDLLSIH